MRQAIVAGNWKMNGDKAFIEGLLATLKPNCQNAAAQVIVFPPYLYLPAVQQTLQDTGIAWGAQNVSANEPGAFTGEIAANQLLEFGTRYCLVGHSERRHIYNEDDVLVAMKFAQAQRYGITPVLCIGETLTHREQGLTETVVFQQLNAVLSLESGIKGFENAVIAYEPVWAIGTGQTATPDQAQELHEFIRGRLAEYDAEIASKVSILYGGSVKAANARELFAMPDIDGGLVGGASLDAKEFVEIVQCIK